ncbi:MAG: hypoxanthine phosphoribosyltransferase [Alphaproteobacteria bacterium]
MSDDARSAVLDMLFDETAIARRVEGLAEEIAAVLPGEFLLLGVLNGAFVFVADLARAMARRGARPRVEFVTLKSYGDATRSSGVVKSVGALPEGLKGMPVLVVDDVLDSGRTAAFVRRTLEEAGAGPVWLCVLLDKPSRREVPGTADFVGFTIADRFVVGYGIDYAGRYRELPWVAALD